ncbi:GNAT family N-acetyltransferase [Streptomyces sp. TRM70308]|uniref:GNAT family N-acetyltransferase n=1 Tax=Streptomyces sp. TRM70308 TaxID=3131932 RepID=UPI003D00888F
MLDGYEISSDPARLDTALVHRWLSRDTYWALGRSREQQERAIAGSLNFGVYAVADGAQVAYARVITDRATFAWLCDVYVAPPVRGSGLGTRLVEAVCAELGPDGPRRVMLATHDAHGVYAKLGFTPLDTPEHYMARVAP